MKYKIKRPEYYFGETISTPKTEPFLSSSSHHITESFFKLEHSLRPFSNPITNFWMCPKKGFKILIVDEIFTKGGSNQIHKNLI